MRRIKTPQIVILRGCVHFFSTPSRSKKLSLQQQHASCAYSPLAVGRPQGTFISLAPLLSLAFMTHGNFWSRNLSLILDLSKKPFFSGLVDYFSSGPIVAMVWEGPEVILTGRKMLGATNPNSSEPGVNQLCVGLRLLSSMWTCPFDEEVTDRDGLP